MFDINTANGYFLNLVKCAIKGEQPIEKPETVDFEAVYKLALRQRASNLAWYAIEKLNNKPDSELLNKWRTGYKIHLYQTASQEIELDNLTQEFSARGYDVMPLKGSQIRSYYPEADMRVMGDIDLLVRTDKSQEARDKVKKIMLELGYEVDILNDGQVDGYRKSKSIYVEIHFEFMHNTHANYEHFIIDWDNLEKNNNTGYYCMNLVDLYYYNIGHFAKNMSAKGNAFRAVADTYVLWQKLNSDEKQLLNDRLEKINLKKFNDALVYISEIWFDDKYDDKTTQNLQEYLLSNSVYGFERNRAVLSLLYEKCNNDSKNVFCHYMLRIFPSADELRKRFNIKTKNPFIIPFLWFWRVFSLLFSSEEKRKRIKMEFNDINAVSDDEIEFFKSVYDGFGLENYYTNKNDGYVN